MLIRRLTVDDIPAIVTMAEGFISSSPHYASVPFDRKETTDLLVWFSDHPDRLAIVAEDCGELIGFFLGYITSFAFSKAPMARDTALFVLPERRGAVGRRLVQTYVSWAKLRTDRIVLSETAGIAPEAFARVAARCGFVPFGMNFCYAPEDAPSAQ